MLAPSGGRKAAGMETQTEGATPVPVVWNLSRREVWLFVAAIGGALLLLGIYFGSKMKREARQFEENRGAAFAGQEEQLRQLQRKAGQ
jgi:hypothetical protein